MKENFVTYHLQKSAKNKHALSENLQWWNLSSPVYDLICFYSFSGYRSQSDYLFQYAILR